MKSVVCDVYFAHRNSFYPCLSQADLFPQNTFHFGSKGTLHTNLSSSCFHHGKILTSETKNCGTRYVERVTCIKEDILLDFGYILWPIFGSRHGEGYNDSFYGWE